jgi:hypothetical protein
VGLTQQRGNQILDGSIKRADLDTTTAGEALIRKAIAGNSLMAASTGVDSGTGDVTFNTLNNALGQTLVYTATKLTSVILYNDAAKTSIFRTIIVLWTGNQITSLEYRNAANALLQTKTFTYDGSNNLTGVVIT